MRQNPGNVCVGGEEEEALVDKLKLSCNGIKVKVGRLNSTRATCRTRIHQFVTIHSPCCTSLWAAVYINEAHQSSTFRTETSSMSLSWGSLDCCDDASVL